MVERGERKKPSWKQTARANLGAGWHRIAGVFFTEIPLFWKALGAPEGRILRGEEEKAKGLVVEYSGDKEGKTTVIWINEGEDEGKIVFPNLLAGDRIEESPPK